MVNEILDKALGEEKQAFKVTDLKSADWVLRKLNAIQSNIDANKKFAEEERQRLDFWEQSENKKHTDDIAYFESLLGEYLRILRENDPKAKISTPHGTVSTRKQQPHWVYDDSVLSELEEKGMTDFIRIKKEVDKKTLKKAVSVTEDGHVVNADGELINGINVLQVGEKLVIKGGG
jgi:Bacteriophage Mu Gam like protein.